MTVHLCSAGVTLWRQVNDRWPNRDTTSDGWVGDAAHQNQPSDHNPDYSAGGVVRAIDIDKDGIDADELANDLRLCAKSGRDRRRLSYIVFNGRIASGTYPDSYWTWRRYTGADPHRSHIHISFTRAGDRDGTTFPLPVFQDIPIPVDPTPPDRLEENSMFLVQRQDSTPAVNYLVADGKIIKLDQETVGHFLTDGRRAPFFVASDVVWTRLVAAFGQPVG